MTSLVFAQPSAAPLLTYTYPFVMSSLVSVVGDSFVDDWHSRIVHIDDPLSEFHAKFWGIYIAGDQEDAGDQDPRKMRATRKMRAIREMTTIWRSTVLQPRMMISFQLAMS